MQTIHIECGSAAAPYEVILTGTTHEVFLQVGRVDGVGGKSGEELVSAILAAAPGDIVKIERRNGMGELNDGASGEPAVQYLNFDGKPLQTEHRKNGQFHDGMNGEAAFVQHVHENGAALKKVERFMNGVRNDGAKGEPAVQWFENGVLVISMRFKNGMMTSQYNRKLPKAAKPPGP